MKLLELLPQLEKYGRVKRQLWSNRFLIKPIDEFQPMINCDLNSLIIKEYFLSYNDLISDDWEIIR